MLKTSTLEDSRIELEEMCSGSIEILNELKQIRTNDNKLDDEQRAFLSEIIGKLTSIEKIYEDINEDFSELIKYNIKQGM